LGDLWCGAGTPNLVHLVVGGQAIKQVKCAGEKDTFDAHFTSGIDQHKGAAGCLV
jgi:hypothetical protein